MRRFAAIIAALTLALSCLALAGPTASSVASKAAGGAASAASGSAPARGSEIAKQKQEIQKRLAQAVEEGKWDQAKLQLERLLALEPDDPVTWYNLGCTHARLGNNERAIQCLQTALEKGYSDFRFLQRDSDLAGLRKLPAYRQLIQRNEQVQRSRADRIQADLRKQFGEGYIVQVDHEDKLVFATNIDARTLEEVKAHLTGMARGLWSDLLANRLEQYVSVVVPSSGDRAWTTYGAGYYNHRDRMLLARQIGMVLSHEFTHALHAADQDAKGQSHPIWLAEGLACLYEVNDLDRSHIVPRDNHRLNVLQQLLAKGKTIPLAELLGYTQAQFMQKSLTCYPQAKYVLMYLYRQGLLKKWYDLYCSTYNIDPTGAKALQRVLGKDLPSIEADWKRWVAQVAAPQLRVQANQPYIGVAVSGQTDGLKVNQIVPGSGAERAGLKLGDLICRIDGQMMVDPDGLVGLVTSHDVGDELAVEVRRAENYRTLRVTLQPMPAQLAGPPSQPASAKKPAPNAASKGASKPTSRSTSRKAA